MDNRMRRVSLGAKVLSCCCSAVLIMILLLMINTIIVMLTEFSFLDQSFGVIEVVLTNLVLFGAFLAMAVGTWLVTTGDERIQSLALLNVNRFLARGFGALAFLLIGLSLADEMLSSVFGVGILTSSSNFGVQRISDFSMWLLAPWLGCIALHYAWLFYETGLFSRKRARRFGILIILGAVASILLWLEHIGALSLVLGSGTSSPPSSLVSFVLNVLVMWSWFAVFVYIIQMPYLMKPMKSTCDQPVSEE